MKRLPRLELTPRLESTQPGRSSVNKVNRKLPHSLKVKVKVYCTVIKSVRVCETETWALKRKEELLLMRTQMNMIRMMGVEHLAEETSKN